MDSGHKHDQDGRSKLIVVAGGREFNDYPLLKRSLDRILPTFGEDITIVSGTARGADPALRGMRLHGIDCRKTLGQNVPACQPLRPIRRFPA